MLSVQIENIIFPKVKNPFSLGTSIYDTEIQRNFEY